MADDYDYEDDDFLYDDEDYIYAEESWSLADELASNAMPQPAWHDPIYELFDDYDMYHYFEDIEYGNDDFMDPDDRPEDDPQSGDKRKGHMSSSTSSAKRRRITDLGYPPVLWMPMVYRLDQKETTHVKPFNTFSLFPDWRDRFKDAPGWSQAAPTTSLNLMASGKSAYTEEELGDADLEGDWEDEDEEEDQDQDMDDPDTAGGIDPEILKGILSAKGISGPDQDAFLHSLMQMMQGGGEAGDDVLENLTSTLLGRVTEDGSGSAMTQWLSQKGVDLVDEEQPEIDSPMSSAAVETQQEHNDNGVTEANGNDDDKLHSAKEPAATPSTKEPSTTPSAGDNGATSSKKRKKVSFAPVANLEPIKGEDATLSSHPVSKRMKVDNHPPATGKLKNIKSASGKATAKQKPTPLASSMELPQSDHESKAETISSRKRKAPATQETGSQDIKPKRQLRGGFAAPTASSTRKVSDPTKKAGPTESAKPIVETTVKKTTTRRSGRKKE